MVPVLQVPVAPLAPQPEQVLPTVRVVALQLSAHVPFEVEQPVDALQLILQHPLPVQVVVVAEHEHVPHEEPLQ